MQRREAGCDLVALALRTQDGVGRRRTLAQPPVLEVGTLGAPAGAGDHAARAAVAPVSPECVRQRPEGGTEQHGSDHDQRGEEGAQPLDGTPERAPRRNPRWVGSGHRRRR